MILARAHGHSLDESFATMKGGRKLASPWHLDHGSVGLFLVFTPDYRVSKTMVSSNTIAQGRGEGRVPEVSPLT